MIVILSRREHSRSERVRVQTLQSCSSDLVDLISNIHLLRQLTYGNATTVTWWNVVPHLYLDPEQVNHIIHAYDNNRGRYGHVFSVRHTLTGFVMNIYWLPLDL